MNYAFKARKNISTDSNEKNKYIGVNVLFCNHCHKMNEYWKFYQTEEKISEDFFKELHKKYANNYYSIVSYGDIIEGIADSFEKKRHHYFLDDFKKKEKKEIEKIKFKYRTKTELLRICPACGEIIKEKDIKPLVKTKSWQIDNIFYYKKKITTEDDKIILSANLYAVFPNTEAEKIKYKDINIRFVFSLKDHNVYAFQPYDVEKNKPLFKKERRILNITYMMNSSNYLQAYHKEVLNDSKTKRALLKEFDKYNGTSYKDFFENYDMNHIPIKYLILYFRYGKYNLDVIRIIDELTKESYTPPAIAQRRKIIFQDIYKMQFDYTLLPKIIKQKKCPNAKLLKKMAAHNPFMIYMYKMLTKMGFKDYNVIISILNIYSTQTFLMKTFLRYERTDYNLCQILISNMVKKKGEIYTKKNIFDYISISDKQNARRSTIPILVDTARMYTNILADESGEFNPDNYFGNIDDMHNTYIRIESKIKHKNKRIPYKKKTLEFNATIGEYQFVCAPDTYSLVECGEMMGICVGGYGNYAVEGSCIIVFILQKDKFVGCLEIARDGKTLIQAKAKYNNLLQEDKAIALKTWVEKNELKVNGCYDYKHILNDEISFDENKNYQRDYNYAAIVHEDLDSVNKNIHINQNYYIIDENK